MILLAVLLIEGGFFDEGEYYSGGDNNLSSFCFTCSV